MYILADRYCIPSAKILRDSLLLLTDGKLKAIVTCNPLKVKGEVIRYGSSYPVGSGVREILNSANVIRLFSNKLKLSKLLLEKGLYTPEFRTNTPENFPVMIRSTLTGEHGRGISIAESQEAFSQIWRSGFYWTPWINLSSEFRVHVFNGEVIKLFKKIFNNPEEKFPIRINDNCHFSLVSKPFEGLTLTVKKLSEAIGEPCFFGADIGWDRNKKDYFIIECNSAPGLNELTGEHYAQKILEYLNYADQSTN